MTLTQTFDAEAEKFESFDMEREVAQFYADFPEPIRRVFFVEVDGNRITRINRPQDKYLNTYLPDSVRASASEYASGINTNTNGSCVPFFGQRWVIVQRQPSMTDTRERLFEETDIFDHEVGHAICTYGIPEKLEDGNLSECVAYAHAVLRHMQRFGTETDHPSNTNRLSLSDLFFNKANRGQHFATPVIDAIIEDSRVYDFSHLTPRQTAELASRYAIVHAPQFAVLQDAVDHMPNFEAMLENPDYCRIEMTRRMALHVLDSRNPYTQRYGHRLLLPILTDLERWTGQTEPIPQDGAWVDIRDRFATLGAELAAENPLHAGMSIPKRAAPHKQLCSFTNRAG